MILNTFKILSFISLILTEMILLKLEPNEVAGALIGGLCGGIVLVCFETQRTWIDAIIKILLSTIASIFITPAFLEYYQVEKWQYVNLWFFFISIAGTFLLKTLLMITKRDLGDIIRERLRQFAGVPTKKEFHARLERKDK